MLVEKPVAGTLEDADKMIAAVDRTGVPVLVGHHRRFSPFCVRVREAFANGELGDLIGVSVMWAMLKPKDYYNAEWRTKKATGGGPLLINVIHNIDDLRYMTLRDVTRIYAETSNRTRGLEVEDTISISLRLQGDALATIFVSDCAPAIWAYESSTAPWENPFFYYTPADCYHFFGTKGALTLPQMQHVFYPDPAKGRLAVSDTSGSAWRQAGPSIAPGDEPLLPCDPQGRDAAHDGARCSQDARRGAGDHAIARYRAGC